MQATELLTVAYKHTSAVFLVSGERTAVDKLLRNGKPVVVFGFC